MNGEDTQMNETNKPNIVFMLPSFSGDIEYTHRLIKSYHKYNIDNIRLYIIVPRKDIHDFDQFVDDNVYVLPEELVSGNYLVHDDSVRGIRPGYINQEIIKISFWEMGLCENYLCLDSDAVFIRGFYIKDFMYNDITPYTILVEDHELHVEPEYYHKYWVGREKLIREIQKEICLNDNRMLTCHGFAILSCKVLKSLKEKYMNTNKKEYADLLKIAPYEFSWYNMWLQKDNTIPIKIKEPLFKYFHQRSHHIDYLRKGITLHDISRAYLGVVINSNYSRGYGVISYEDGNVYPFRFYKKVIAFMFQSLF